MPGLDEHGVALDRLHVGVPHLAEEAARARAEAEVLLPSPVALVVARAEAGARVVGDFVMLESGLRGRLREGPVLRGDRLFGREPRHAAGVPEAALVQGEAVGGEVIRAPRDHLAHGGGPRREVEAGQAVDQIHADVVRLRLPRGREGGAGLPGGVAPVQARQDRVVQALHAEAHAGDPGSAVAGDALRGHVVRVALDRHLGARLHREARANPVQQRRHLVDGEERGRAAAEEQGVEPDAARPGRGVEQVPLGQERGEEAILAPRGVRRGVERAVPAALDAERQVHVGPEPGGPGPERRYGRY